MCLSPIPIRNLNEGCHPSGERDPRFFVDTVSKYILVGCGHCKQCIALRQSQYIQRVLMESMNNHIFMATLTMDNEHLPYLTTSLGYRLTYADHYTLVKCFKRIARWELLPFPLRYFGVWERGGLRHRPHFHLLFFVPKKLYPTYDDVLNCEHMLYWTIRNNWCINVGSNWHPRYEPMFQYHEKWINGSLKRNYDLHYVNPSLSEYGVCDAGFYVLKYMLKQSEYERKLKAKIFCTYSPDEAYDIWSKVRSRCFYSTYFGLNARRTPFGDVDVDPDIESYIRKCIKDSKGQFPYPCFYNPNTAQSFPLAEFYKKFNHNGYQLYTFDDAFEFFHFEGNDSALTTFDLTMSEVNAQMDSFIHMQESVKGDFDDYIDDLC